MKIAKDSKHIFLCLWLFSLPTSIRAIKERWRLGYLFNVEIRILWTVYWELDITLPFLAINFYVYHRGFGYDNAKLFEFKPFVRY